VPAVQYAPLARVLPAGCGHSEKVDGGAHLTRNRLLVPIDVCVLPHNARPLGAGIETRDGVVVNRPEAGQLVHQPVANE
jgi:hypothetical protein